MILPSIDLDGYHIPVLDGTACAYCCLPITETYIKR
jgi:hypothetical protein